ncbi:leucine-rich repeat domain-containing protein [Cohnella suwonensis]|uniref:Leucine-rich repeat domain-containing protein n=1 Tax=Cohnella suwonensis TaxID=696072 RepID=A0ABW0LUG7_9BACL
MRTFRSLVLLLAVVLVTPFYASQFAQAEEVVFADPVLDQAVRQQLGITGSLSQTDLDQLYSLVLNEGTVTSLNGLEHAHNLVEFTLNNANVSDLTPLASLAELNYLSMNNNRIQDIRPLTGLRKLYYLDLSGNQISDISSLSGVTSLMELHLANNPINLKENNNRNALISLRQKGVDIDIEIEDTLPVEQSQEEQPIVVQGPTLTWTKLFKEYTDADYRTNKYSEYAYGNGIHVSSEGYTSKDAVHWTRNPAKISFKDVVFGKGRFVAVGREDSDEIPIWTSIDGINWTETARLPANAYLSLIAFSGTRFVVAGGRNSAGSIFSSEDGTKWTERKTGMTTTLKGLEWGNNAFVALGYQGAKFLVSKDGITWKKVNIPVKPYVDMWSLSFGMGFSGKAFFATNYEDAYITSKDGVKWTTIAKDANGILWGEFRRITDRYYAIGFKTTNGKRVSSYRTSKDGVKWTDVKYNGKAEDFGLDEVIRDGKQYFSYTSTAIYASADGVNWKQTKKINRIPPYLFRSAIGNGKMVLIGGGSSDAWGFVTIDSSGKVAYDMEDTPYKLHDVIWTGSQFFAVGSAGVMMTSKDGTAWKKAASPTKQSLSRIIRANGTYYVTGSNGLIMTSKDLKTWKTQKTNTETDLYSIAWNGKKFVAVGDWGVTLVSDNGTSWKAGSRIKDSRGDSVYELSDVMWGNGTFIIAPAQKYNLDIPYTVFRSADGTKWTKEELGDSKERFPSIFGVHYLGNTFVAVGDYGAVFLSKDGDKWSREETPDSPKLFAAELFNGKLYTFGLGTQIYAAEFKTQ